MGYCAYSTGPGGVCLKTGGEKNSDCHFLPGAAAVRGAEGGRGWFRSYSLVFDSDRGSLLIFTLFSKTKTFPKSQRLTHTYKTIKPLSAEQHHNCTLLELKQNFLFAI